jgi:uncharacterized protein involved in outer membrane biogenesis
MPLSDHHKNRLAEAWSGIRERIVADFRDFRFTWRGFWRWTGIVISAVLVAAIVTLYFLDWNQLRGPIGRYLSNKYDREVRIDGDLKVHLFRWQPRIDVAGLYIGNPDWVPQKQGANIRYARIEMRLLPLFRGDLILPLVQIDRPDVLVVRDADGRTNWDGRENDKEPFDLPPIRRFLINDGHLVIEDAVRKLKFTGTINSQEEAGGRNAAFTLEGDGTLNGNIFTANVRGGPLLNVDESRPYEFDATLRAGQTHATAKGSITHPFDLARFDAALTLRGPNLADLYYLTGLTLPGTPPYQVRGNLKRDGMQYRFTAIRGGIGKSDISGDLAINVAGDIPAMTGKLASRQLTFEDLGALFGGGKAAPPAERASDRLLPDVTLHTERLRQMNAEVDYSALDVKSEDFPLRGFGTHISLQGGVLVLKPLAFQFPQGRLSGELKIDGRKAVAVSSVDARFSDLKIESFIQSADKPLSGTVEARAKLTGTGKSVHDAASTANGLVTVVVPQGGMRRSLAEWLGVDVITALGLTLTGDESNTQLRCAVASFDSKNGVLVSRQLVLDTDPVRIDGGGNINLADETFSLRVQGHPKNFQPFRLRVPIGVSGKLINPQITINPVPALTQGGLGVALGAINPFAAILAFIDPGLAKDANCAALLADARNKGAPVTASAMQRAPPVRK